MKYLIIVVVLLGALPTAAQELTTVQGRLTNAAGIRVDGVFDLTFRLFDAEVAGTEVFKEDYANVVTKDGIFSLDLGQDGTLPAIIAANDTLWLEVKVGADLPLPRRPLRSVARAMVATVAKGVSCNGCIPVTVLGFDTATQAELNAQAATLSQTVSDGDNVQAVALTTHADSGDHDTRYVNLAGDAMTGGLSVNDTLEAKADLSVGGAIQCTGCMPVTGLGFDTATQAELNAQAATLSQTVSDGDNVQAVALTTHADSGDHDTRYVNLAGDTMTGDLRARNFSKLIWQSSESGTFKLRDIFDEARNNGLINGVYDCVLRTSNQAHWTARRFVAAVNLYTKTTNANHTHKYHNVINVEASPSGCSGGLASLSPSSGQFVFTKGNCNQNIALRCSRLD